MLNTQEKTGSTTDNQVHVSWKKGFLLAFLEVLLFLMFLGYLVLKGEIGLTVHPLVFIIPVAVLLYVHDKTRRIRFKRSSGKPFGIILVEEKRAK